MAAEPASVLEREQLLSLLAQAESKLRDSRREIDAVLTLLQQSAASIAADAGSPRLPGAAQDLGAQRDEIVRLVVAALDGGRAAADLRAPPRHALTQSDDDDTYRIGRRRLGLTEMEKRVLDVLWHNMPGPASRQTIHQQLYSDAASTASEGIVDVFVSKLRQKLKLASGGEDLLRSVRGKGWALRQELCHAPAPDSQRD